MVAIYSHLIFWAPQTRVPTVTCVNMHLDRHQPSRRLALVTHGSDDRTIMNKYKTASHTTRLSVCGTRRTQMVTVCPARLAIAIYPRVMITSDVVGHAVPYEIPVDKYMGWGSRSHESPVEVWPFDSHLAVVRWKRDKEYEEVCVVTDQPGCVVEVYSKRM